MFSFITKIFYRFKTGYKNLKQLTSAAPSSYTPRHRIVSIDKKDDETYRVTVQVIGKGAVFTEKPEKLLADDNMVCSFSPIDVRTLTYLGYLGIHDPKYKILAKRLSESNDKMLFALYRKGSKGVSIKNAEEISTNKDILHSLDQKDAHMIGYTIATEQLLQEEKQKIYSTSMSEQGNLT